MLCPQCRRQVGKDGYCPSGHLARPELQERQQRRSAPPPVAPAFPPIPPAPGAPAASPATPGAWPSRFDAPSPELGAPPPGVGAPPPSFGPPSRGKGKRAAVVVGVIVLALAVFAFTFLGSSAGASDLRVKFTSGEEHTYALEMTMTGRGGNLNGGFETNIGIGAEMTQRTGAVDKDGNATLNYTLKNFHFSQDGHRTTPPAGVGAAYSVRMRPDGTVIGLDGGDPFGLEDINPAGQFVNPSNAGPLLPKKKVLPGQSWTVEANQSVPDIGTVHAKAVNTLVERRKIGGNDAAVIHSVVSVPLNFRFGHKELVEQAKNDGEDGSDIPANASITMIGNMSLNFTQTIFTSNGLLQSVLGDGSMRGTMTIGGIPGVEGGLPIAFDLDFQITMQKISTGQAA
jgi:hypothetical protein